MLTSVKINLSPVSVIESKLGIQSGGPAHKHFTNECARHMDKYVPATSELNLASSVRTTTDKIIYPGPYAHYMYEGKVMGPNIPIIENGIIVGYWSKAPKYYTGEDIQYNTSTHSLATSHWDKKMWSAEKDEIEDDLANYIKRGCK
jgi:hypothetical protein